MIQVHPTAIVHPKAVLGDGTTVGAFSIVGENVVLGRECEIQEHVVLRGHTTFGDRAKVFPFVVAGAEPQHLQYRGEPTTTEIGNDVTLRESVTVHRGTVAGGGVTRIGDNSFIMAYTHVAHDCLVGKKVIIANNVQLAGHVEVHDNVVIGGQCAIAQFCRIGRNCYIGGGSIMRKDIPPFLVGKGTEFQVQGINAIGLTRAGFSKEAVTQLRAMFKIFYLQGNTVSTAIEKIQTEVGETDEIREFIEFVKSSKSGITR